MVSILLFLFFEALSDGCKNCIKFRSIGTILKIATSVDTCPYLLTTQFESDFALPNLHSFRRSKIKSNQFESHITLRTLFEGSRNGIDNNESAGRNTTTTDENDSDNNNEEDISASAKMKSMMLSWIGWYRSYISPVMPPNCRFLPSCSVYAIDAINKFGPWRGLVLTAWRIFRCNPLGGTAWRYDPPRWPPPPYF